MNKLDKLDAIRGFAALYVVFHHSFFSDNFVLFNKNLSFFFKFGQEAVILFFLMSGFVISYSFEKSRDKSFTNYFSKRFYRIYIPLLIVLLTHYLFNSLQAGHFVDPEWLHLGGNLLMLQDAGGLKPNVIISTYLGNSPLWSLSYEWWFYMSFYLLYTMFKDSKKLDWAVSILVVISAVSYIFYPFFLNRLFMYLGIWWAGVVMGKSYLNNSTVKIKDLGLIFSTLVVVVAILCVNAYLHKSQIKTIGIYPLLELRHVGFTLVAIVGSIIWQAFRWKGFNVIGNRFKFIAPFSYVLYITHYFLVVNATYLAFIGNKYITFFIYLLVAAAFSYLVEVVLYPRIRNTLTGKSRKPVVLVPSGN